MEASSVDILLEPLDTDDVSEVEDVAETDETKVRTYFNILIREQQLTISFLICRSTKFCKKKALCSCWMQ